MYVIDGYNLLHCLLRNSLFPAEFAACRSRMVDLLSTVATREQTRVRVFFDGSPGPSPNANLARPAVSIEYTHRVEADAAICSHVGEAADPASLIVVSSDRDIGAACRSEGARVVSSADFTAHLEHHLSTPRIAQSRDYGFALPVSQRQSAPPATAQRRNTPVVQVSAPAPAPAGGLEHMVREMLSRIGPLDELVRDALSRPLPTVRVVPVQLAETTGVRASRHSVRH